VFDVRAQTPGVRESRRRPRVAACPGERQTNGHDAGARLSYRGEMREMFTVAPRSGGTTRPNRNQNERPDMAEVAQALMSREVSFLWAFATAANAR